MLLNKFRVLETMFCLCSFHIHLSVYILYILPLLFDVWIEKDKPCKFVTKSESYIIYVFTYHQSQSVEYEPHRDNVNCIQQGLWGNHLLVHTHTHTKLHYYGSNNAHRIPPMKKNWFTYIPLNGRCWQAFYAFIYWVIVKSIISWHNINRYVWETNAKPF